MFPISQFAFAIYQFGFAISQFMFAISQFAFTICQFVFAISQFIFTIILFAFAISQFVFAYSLFIFDISKFSACQRSSVSHDPLDLSDKIDSTDHYLHDNLPRTSLRSIKPTFLLA